MLLGHDRSDIMATTNNKHWGRSIKIHPKIQSFEQYIEGAAEWAKKNLTTHCKICKTKIGCTSIEVTGSNIIAIFKCNSGHTTTQTTKESELRRAYNKANGGNGSL